MAKFEFDPVKQRGSTERTRRLRAESMSTQPHIYIERAYLMLLRSLRMKIQFQGAKLGI